MIRPFRIHALLFLAVLVSGPAISGPEVNRTLLIRIDNVKPDALQKTGILNYDEYDYRSIISVVRDTALVLVTPAERAILTERGFASTVIMEDTSELTLIRRAMYGPTMKLEKPYHSYQEIVQRLHELEKSFPSLVRASTIGSTTQKKQPIYAVTISGKDEKKTSDRPSIMIDGCHHSNEVMGAEISLATAEMLATQYGMDPDVTRWLDNLRIVIVPVVNVDGHDVVTSGQDPRWRKNRHAPDGDAPATYPFGTDINRNYDFNWGGGGAGEPSSGRYRGTFPFSEAEPRAIAALARNERFLLSITYHSQGEVIYYPWNWKGLPAPDDALILPMARALAGSIPNMRGDSSYKAEPGAALVGQSYPWLYGTLGTFDFIVETGYGAAIFPPYEVSGIVNANLNGIRTMLRRAEGPGVAFHVTDASTDAPLEATVWFPRFETEEVNRRTTNPATGTLYRFLTPIAHQVIISKPGYETTVLPSVKPPDSGWQRVEVQLKRSAK
jgi:carboxypeptidase T